MGELLVYPLGTTEACRYSAAFLKEQGVSLVDHPAPEVTHLLLDVPSFGSDGKLRGGEDLSYILTTLPENITVVGGNLHHPLLTHYRTLDLLQDLHYLAQNAAITAECALQVAAPHLKTTFSDAPVLVIGWGRIGKCLGMLLKALGCEVTIAARKEEDRAMIRALGYQAADIRSICNSHGTYRLVFNTAPSPILHKHHTQAGKNCVFVDLASQQGILGEDVIWARGLPGIYAPESSGRLIAETFLKLSKEASE